MLLVYKYHQLKSTPMLEPISGRVDTASATEMIDVGSIPVVSNQRLEKLGFTASLLDVQQLKGQCEAFIMYGSLTQRPKGPFAVSRPR